MTSPTSSTTWSSCIVGRSALETATPPLIGVLDGEGSGPEVVSAALRVLEALQLPVEIRRGGVIGNLAEQQFGEAMPTDVTQFCREIFDGGGAIFHGAGGGRFVYDLRRAFDLYCKIALVRAEPALAGVSRFKPETLANVDCVIVRENSEGVYQGEWDTQTDGNGLRVARHTFSYSEFATRRIIEVAARIAEQRRGELTVVVKDGGVPSVSTLWRECASEITNVQTRVINVDFAAYELVQNPQSFDVIVTPNLFGDILVDLSGVVTGSRALACSGNFSATAAVFQTNHGAAYDIAGRDIVNPVGQIFALAMMLREQFGLNEQADCVERAVRGVWRDGWRTADIAEAGCRTIGTRDMSERIAAAIASE